MVITRGSCAKSVAQTQEVDDPASPLKQLSTPKKTESPRKLPVPRPSPRRHLCEACRINEVSVSSSSSTLVNDVFRSNVMLNDFNVQLLSLQKSIKHIGEKINLIENVISRNHSIITGLQNGLSHFANRLDKVCSTNILSCTLISSHLDNNKPSRSSPSKPSVIINKSSP